MIQELRWTSRAGVHHLHGPEGLIAEVRAALGGRWSWRLLVDGHRHREGEGRGLMNAQELAEQEYARYV